MSKALLAYLGPPGTFSEAAALRYVSHFYGAPAAAAATGSVSSLLPCPTIPDTLGALLQGKADEALVPLENALEGSVPLVLNALLTESGLWLRGEVVVPVEHCLLGLPGTSIDTVETVVSYPHALAQCRRFLREVLPSVKVEEASSTAAGAALVAARGDRRLAAIAPARAAEIYNLEILARGIEDEKNNATRFVAVGWNDRPPSPHGKDKTSLILVPETDRPGLLYDLLGEFASRRINLTRIESRPSRRRLGEYNFYIDCEGHRLLAPLSEAIAALARQEVQVRVLGSYPAWPLELSEPAQ
ncbi:MAG: prephenate dehydratase [Limnochordales bacterium]|nr:prephenate dehydratase [Limnochordales bacterium]